MSLRDFQIIHKLGDGSYSSVYKVKRLNDGIEYALKKVKLLNLTDKEKQNALNEVRILASIRNPNIIGYKEAFLEENSNSLCIIMEYANNGDLYQKIIDHQKKNTLLPEGEIWNIFTQLIKGLKALHDLKIFHRDLKSANVFLNKDGSVKLGDLNVSKIAKKGLLYTQTGTPYYASPEVWKDQPYDQKSDVWSAGCVLYEMCTLKPPFRAEDMDGLYKKVLKGSYPKISPHYSQDLNNVIKSLLQVNPISRPACDKILQNLTILKRLDDKLLIEMDETLESNLLNTIRIPNNLHYLTERLPKPNYNPINVKKVEKNKFLQTLNGNKKDISLINDLIFDDFLLKGTESVDSYKKMLNDREKNKENRAHLPSLGLPNDYIHNNNTNNNNIKDNNHQPNDIYKLLVLNDYKERHRQSQLLLPVQQSNQHQQQHHHNQQQQNQPLIKQHHSMNKLNLGINSIQDDLHTNNDGIDIGYMKKNLNIMKALPRQSSLIMNMVSNGIKNRESSLNTNVEKEKNVNKALKKSIMNDVTLANKLINQYSNRKMQGSYEVVMNNHLHSEEEIDDREYSRLPGIISSNKLPPLSKNTSDTPILISKTRIKEISKAYKQSLIEDNEISSSSTNLHKQKRSSLNQLTLKIIPQNSMTEGDPKIHNANNILSLQVQDL